MNNLTEFQKAILMAFIDGDMYGKPDESSPNPENDFQFDLYVVVSNFNFSYAAKIDPAEAEDAYRKYIENGDINRIAMFHMAR